MEGTFGLRFSWNNEEQVSRYGPDFILKRPDYDEKSKYIDELERLITKPEDQ